MQNDTTYYVIVINNTRAPSANHRFLHVKIYTQQLASNTVQLAHTTFDEAHNSPQSLNFLHNKQTNRPFFLLISCVGNRIKKG